MTYTWTSRVLWHPSNPHVFASSHAGEVRVWDARKVSSPTSLITAHITPIISFDWSPARAEELVTLAAQSQSTTAKFWNCFSPKACLHSRVLSPHVHSIRYLPVGGAMIAAVQLYDELIPTTLRSDRLASMTGPVSSPAFPQLRQADLHRSALQLWHMKVTHAPISEFSGHVGPITFVGFRHVQQDACEVVSWSPSEAVVRVWQVDSMLLGALQDDLKREKESIKKGLDGLPNFSVDEAISDFEYGSDSSSLYEMEGAISDRDRDIKMQRDSSGTFSEFPHGVTQELNAITQMYPASLLSWQKDSPGESTISLDISVVDGSLLLKVYIPPGYPATAVPVFYFPSGVVTSPELLQQCRTLTKKVAREHLETGSSSLHSCIQQLLAFLQQKNLLSTEELPPNSYEAVGRSSSMAGLAIPSNPLFSTRSSGAESSYNAAVTPFPALCGASFSPSGKLVCFYNGLVIRKLRTMREYLDIKKEEQLDDGMRSINLSPMKFPPRTIIKTRRVILRGCDLLTRTSISLFADYRVLGLEPQQMCLSHRNAAEKAERKDIVRLWSSLLPLMEPRVWKDPSRSTFSPYYPFGTKLLSSIFETYERERDLQTLAMVSLLLLHPSLNLQQGVEGERGEEDDTQVITAAGAKDGKDESRTAHELGEVARHQFTGASLLPWPIIYHWRLISAYASLLYSFGHLTLAAETWSCIPSWTCSGSPSSLLEQEGFASAVEVAQKKKSNNNNNNNNSNNNKHSEAVYEIQTFCRRCKGFLSGTTCAKCNLVGMQCAICRLCVQGMAATCLACGHGGHLRHLRDWFLRQDRCPSGCGCQCLEQTQSLAAWMEREWVEEGGEAALAARDNDKRQIGSKTLANASKSSRQRMR